MPWKDRYTISTERAIADADVAWPGDATVAFTVTVNLSPACGPDGITARDLKTPEAYFGVHGGLDALRKVLDRYGIRATVASPGIIAELYPSIIGSLAGDGHEIAANTLAGEDVSLLDAGEERQRLIRTTAAITEAAGQRPLGWYSLPRPGDKYAGGAISGDTVSLLIEQGYAYLGNSLADDRPHYWVTDPDGPTSILALPYYYHFDDQFFLMFPQRGTGLEHADALERNWRDEFAAQYRRGLEFHMTLHPHAIGWPHRLRMLDRFLADATALPGVWKATGREIADHWQSRFPASSVVKIEPSIWQDYEDSLS